MRRVSRAATAGLLVVFLGLSAFAAWSTRYTSLAAKRAVAASVMTDHYEQALKSMISEEAAEEAYRLGPSPALRLRYQAAEDVLVAAMAQVGRAGTAADRASSDRVLALHDSASQSVRRMFAAMDRQDPAAARNLVAQDIDPRFAELAQNLAGAADAHRRTSLAAVRELRTRVAFTGAIRPIVFVIGFVLMLVLSWVLQRIRQRLYWQREQALRNSLHDPLTGLANRAMLAERFAKALRHDYAEGTRTGLLLLDLDRFKDINDTLGHHYGDELLTQIGPRLHEALRPEDTVARLGGDEFAVVLPGVEGLDDALLVAEKLRYALTAPFAVDGMELDVEASIGVVVSGDHGDDPSTLLQRADIAMYVAKKQNIGVFPYDPDFDVHTPQKLTLLSDLRRALERQELVLHYQPKLDLATGDVCGVEALARWEHPQHGLLLPGSFIPLAEHTGLIAPLTDYVLEAALTQARSWADQGLEIPIAVNLSTRNLLDAHLVDKIEALLQRHGLAASALELEVTESALLTDPMRAQQTVIELRELGLHIAIDDFGVGYTNLSQLKTLPVTELKIDRSFVTSMVTDANNAHIVKSVIDLSHNLGIVTIAEGVETQVTMNALRAAGCDIVQGHHIARPAPADVLVAWLASRRQAVARSAIFNTRN